MVSAYVPEGAQQRLVNGMARREAASLERFYQAHVDGLYAAILGRVRGDASLAEDVVQETFLEALRRADSYDPSRGSPRAWLWMLSRNVLRKHLRDHPRRRRLDELAQQLDATHGQLQAALADGVASDELLEREETRALVTATIASLDPNHRRLLRRKYVAGDSLAAIASDLAISPEAVKSSLARARRAFRERFAELAPP